MLGTVKLVGYGLVDGDSYRFGGLFGFVATVDGFGCLLDKSTPFLLVLKEYFHF